MSFTVIHRLSLKNVTGGQEVAGSNPVSPTRLMPILNATGCQPGSHDERSFGMATITKDEFDRIVREIEDFVGRPAPDEWKSTMWEIREKLKQSAEEFEQVLKRQMWDALFNEEVLSRISPPVNEAHFFRR